MTKARILFVSIFILFSNILLAQVDLSYYLPKGVTYNSKIPAPKSIIGHEVGEWHISHDRLVSYMYAVAAASDRVSIQETGRTFETRPLLLLTVTSPKNQSNLEAIRSQHVQLTDPKNSGSLNVAEMPAVLYTGFSIHGNEASGSNASLAAIYHLAAAEGPEIEKLLDEVVILFDPSFNPDGLQRFSSWVNSRRASQVISDDSNDTEHNEPWPGGRTNHYWFDLNRDWLVAQLPESQARITQFHQWKPNILTDHHEMGTNSTFFFQPGVPSRNHPLTPARNFELTKKIGEFHAKKLDQIGSLYYAQENFDDFYYGKGSTFPDVQGAIGILFEQASSRGHAQESIHGSISFPFTIRNQFTAFLSTLEAAQSMRVELLNYQRDFFKTNAAEAAKDPVKGYVFGSNNDRYKGYHLAEIIARHDIEVYRLGNPQTINGKKYASEGNYVVTLNQKQYRLIKSMFEKRTAFEDSLFYDISSWTLPIAFDLEFDELKSIPSGLLGERFDVNKKPVGQLLGDDGSYAYVFETYGYYAPRSIYRLLNSDIRLKVADAAFYHPSGKKFPAGSVLIALGINEGKESEIKSLISAIAEKDGIDVYGFSTGLDYSGVSLGSPSFSMLRNPKIAMLVDEGVTSSDAGEIWHLLDTRFQIPVSLVPTDVANRLGDFNKYNTLIMTHGSYQTLNDATKEKLRSWTQSGGVIVGMRGALSWLHKSGIGKFEIKSNEPANGENKPYSALENTMGAQQIGGAIFQLNVDLSHPLFYGYERTAVPIFKSGNLFMEQSKNQFGNPAVFTGSPLISGYISSSNLEKLKNCSMAGSNALGQGRVIGFTENLAFRAFWFGSNKMLMNAIFYGHTIAPRASR